MNSSAVIVNYAMYAGMSVLPEQSVTDIILRVFIGMALITALIWLAAVAAGRIGSRFRPGGDGAESAGDGTETDTEQTEEINDLEEI